MYDKVINAANAGEQGHLGRTWRPGLCRLSASQGYFLQSTLVRVFLAGYRYIRAGLDAHEEEADCFAGVRVVRVCLCVCPSIACRSLSTAMMLAVLVPVDQPAVP